MEGLRKKRPNNRASKGIANSLARVAHGIADLVWPMRCIGCDMPGVSLCDDCEAKLPKIDQKLACRLCGAPYGIIQCTECWTGEGQFFYPFTNAICALEHRDLGSKIVTLYKDAGERGLAKHMSALIAEAIQQRCQMDKIQIDMLTSVPSRPSAIARRGFDHISLLVSELTKLLDINYISTLSTTEAFDQRVLGRQERMQNMQGAFKCDLKLSGNVLLIDDVFTSGATAGAASLAILEAGAQSVIFAALCRVW